MRYTFISGLLLVGAISVAADEDDDQRIQKQKPDWSVDMAFAGACCCDPICPCIFGSDPTHKHCRVNNLFLVKRGHYDKVRLDGLVIATTEEMGKWRRFYIDEQASPEQMDTAVKLFELIPEFKVDEVKSVEKVPVKVKWEKARIRFTTPHSEVVMEPMKGKNGKPIRIENLPLEEDYVQFKSITHKYAGHGLKFDFSGTHASTARIRTGSDKSEKPDGELTEDGQNEATN